MTGKFNWLGINFFSHNFPNIWILSYNFERTEMWKEDANILISQKSWVFFKAEDIVLFYSQKVETFWNLHFDIFRKLRIQTELFWEIYRFKSQNVYILKAWDTAYCMQELWWKVKELLLIRTLVFSFTLRLSFHSVSAAVAAVESMYSNLRFVCSILFVLPPESCIQLVAAAACAAHVCAAAQAAAVLKL